MDLDTSTYEESRVVKLTTLKEEYDSCTKCPKLCETRNKPVFGIGNPTAEIMIIAEAPGKNENERGIPLIGDSGRILDFFLASVMKDERLNKLAKSFSVGKTKFGKTMYSWPQHEKAKEIICETAFYTNVILCWPGKGNRDPEPIEVENCKSRLIETIYLIDPKIIISVGAWAAKILAGKRSISITKERGKVIDVVLPGKVTDIHYPVLPILHPAYLLRQGCGLDDENSDWTRTLNDLRGIMEILEELRRMV